ncbi:MAG: RES family NAD+ phosphorylase [Smithellaceae bacterium]|jgi:hypothetical protein
MAKKRIEFKSWRSFTAFAQKIFQENRFIHDKETRDFLRAVLKTCDARIRVIEKGTLLWRAQLGCDTHKDTEANRLIAEEILPYPPDRMKPLIGQASEGRANPKGIPYLYLSNNKNTALAEVRPWVGTQISISKFKVKQEIRIVDCSVSHNLKIPFYCCELEPSIREEVVWAFIDKAFARPIQSSDNTADYVPTQIIAELFKTQGFDGIKYQSNLGAGQNIILFNIDLAEIVSCSLYKTTKLRFHFEEIKIGPKNRYITMHYYNSLRGKT